MERSAHEPTNKLCSFQTPHEIQEFLDKEKTWPKFNFTCKLQKEADIIGCTNHYSDVNVNPGFNYDSVSTEYKYCIAQKKASGRTEEEQYSDVVIMCAKSEKELFQDSQPLFNIISTCYLPSDDGARLAA